MAKFVIDGQIHFISPAPTYERSLNEPSVGEKYKESIEWNSDVLSEMQKYFKEFKQFGKSNMEKDSYLSRIENYNGYIEDLKERGSRLEKNLSRVLDSKDEFKGDSHDHCYFKDYGDFKGHMKLNLKFLKSDCGYREF